MKQKSVKKADLVELFDRATKVPEEELQAILEMQKIVEEILGAEEKLQAYQLQFTSNW